MAEPFRNLLNPALVELTARHLLRVHAPFPAQAFLDQVLPHFETLEMKARAMRIADALEATLPTDFDCAAERIEASLLPVRGDEPLAALQSSDAGLAGWIVWSLGEYVARRGLHDPARALRCLRELTQRFSAEFAVRPLLRAHPEQVYAILSGWLDDPSPHVRRWISEGTRPRLPWGLALPQAIADPRVAWPLLEALQDDRSDYVRKSVANHLNDVGREHPQLLAEWLQRWLPGASATRRSLLRHASRTSIKRGEPAILAAWGLGQPFRGRVDFALAPARLRLGEALQLRVDLHSTAAQSLVIDWRIHHRRADGGANAKVYKGWSVQVGRGESMHLQRRHPVRAVSTRRDHAGWHRVELQINGVVVAEAGFDLEIETPD